MPSTTRVQVLGLKELGAAMRELTQEVNGRLIFRATLASAKIVKDRASQLAPESEKAHRVGNNGPVVQPGNLKRGIATKKLPKLKPGLAQYEVRWKAKKAGDPFYGLFAEFGTVKQAATPFMRPAFDQTKDATLKKVQETLTRGVAMAVKRAAKLSKT